MRGRGEGLEEGDRRREEYSIRYNSIIYNNNSICYNI
jgi:hypothetical protein